MRRLFQIVDKHILSFCALLLLVFIPLYPKWPLFEVIPGYIVRVRLEDLLIVGACLVYLIQVVRRKAVFWQTPLTKPILLYLLIGFLSVLSALAVTHTVPLSLIHVQKLFLHYFRRIEYFSLFFVFFGSIRSSRQVKIYFGLFLLALVGVIIYGYGQKYLYWPAFSTMNREFAKGWKLYLSEHARVLSTFGGHYDLAAFTMMSLAFLWSLFFGLRNKLYKVATGVILAGSFWLIILTASRVSFIAYLLALTIVIFLWSFQKGVGWGVTRFLAAISLSIIIMLSFGDLSERFMRLFRLNERFGGIRSLLLRPAVAPPVENAIFLENSIAAVTSKSDMPPSTVKPNTGSKAVTNQPADVTNETPDLVEVRQLDGSIKIVEKKRIYSQTALQFDLSTGIRLDALWPRAWQGFLTNPLLGSGYSTLTKSRVTDFTEAESTDNDYLRSLGETGLLGTVAFLAIIFTILFFFFRALGGVRDKVFYAIIVGCIGSIVGLLVNASYIDIFEASKVALPFWSLTGLVAAGIVADRKNIEKDWHPLTFTIDWPKAKNQCIKFFKSDLFFLSIIIALAFVLRLHKFSAPLADWHSWRQADTSAVTRNFDRFGINLLYPTFDDLSSVASGQPNPKGLRMVEFPIYNAAAVWVKKFLPEIGVEGAGRLTSILVSLGSVVFLFLLVRKYQGRRVAYLTALVFAVLPYNIFYSRTILPEPSLVFTTLGMIYFFAHWIDEIKLKTQNSKLKTIVTYLIALTFAALAILIKPYAVFLFLPLLYLVYLNRGWKGFISPWVVGFFAIIIIPFILWRLWISQFPEGIPAYTWLLNGDGIRFKGAFFFWIFADRIARLILGYWGLPLFISGFILTTVRQQTRYFFHFWFLGILLYLFTFATGNVRHDYYQIITVPILSIFVAMGLDFLLFSDTDVFQPWLRRLAGVVCVIFMLTFGWYHVRDYFNINHPEIVVAGQTVKEKTHWRAKVIAPYGGDTAFLYQTERFGWPLVEGTIEDMIAKGASYYVSVTPQDDLTKTIIGYTRKPDDLHPYKLIKDDPQFVIVQLVSDKFLPRD